jgi:hypothetical protein
MVCRDGLSADRSLQTLGECKTENGESGVTLRK